MKTTTATEFRAGDAAHMTINGDTYSVKIGRVSKSGHQIMVIVDADEARLFTRRADGNYRSSGHGSFRLRAGAHETVLDPCH